MHCRLRAEIARGPRRVAMRQVSSQKEMRFAYWISCNSHEEGCDARQRETDRAIERERKKCSWSCSFVWPHHNWFIILFIYSNELSRSRSTHLVATQAPSIGLAALEIFDWSLRKLTKYILFTSLWNLLNAVDSCANISKHCWRKVCKLS